jgi:hypothetical protein
MIIVLTNFTNTKDLKGQKKKKLKWSYKEKLYRLLVYYIANDCDKF